jgi:hypothetical protein
MLSNGENINSQVLDLELELVNMQPARHGHVYAVAPTKTCMHACIRCLAKSEGEKREGVPGMHRMHHYMHLFVPYSLGSTQTNCCKYECRYL